MLQDFRLSVNQLGDRRFRRVLVLGIGLTLALLFGLSVIFITTIGWVIPDSLTLPFIGEIGWVDTAVSWAAVPLMMVLSVFLMVPVASAFTGFFLDEVSQAVEDKHYPQLGEAIQTPWSETIRDTLSFLGVLIAANLAALVLYLFLAPLAPIIFWLLNGFLLGREYFQLVAMRRVGRQQAAVLRKQYGLQIWISGAVMAVPLSIPIVNLLIPVLGAATFTHLFHRLTATPVQNA